MSHLWMITIGIYSLASMLIMFFMVKHSKSGNLAIINLDMRIEIICAIIGSPILMPVICLMLLMHLFSGEKEHSDMGIYFQASLMLIAYVCFVVYGALNVSVLPHSDSNIGEGPSLYPKSYLNSEAGKAK